MEFFRGLNEVVLVEGLLWCLANNKCSNNVIILVYNVIVILHVIMIIIADNYYLTV